MRIAQIAPLYESVPPKQYGGTERVISYLTERLVELGHDVTLFASADSCTAANLVSPCSKALRTNPHCVDAMPYHVLALDQVAQLAAEFDILHFHTDYFHLPLSKNLDLPSLTTLHGRLDIPDLLPLYRYFASAPLVSISYGQRKPLPHAQWIGNVYHGLPSSLYEPCFKTGKYLAFLGRIAPEKGPERAIEIAVRSGIPLKIAAKIDPVDRAYFNGKIKALLDHPLVEFVGEISDREKSEFLGNSYALLFPIDWPEPFGLTMIEAMACGTPTIAFRRGSVPELMCDGITGFVVETVDAALACVPRIPEINRRGCRTAFEKRFMVDRMADDYVRLYKERLGAPADAKVLGCTASSPTIVQ